MAPPIPRRPLPRPAPAPRLLPVAARRASAGLLERLPGDRALASPCAPPTGPSSEPGSTSSTSRSRTRSPRTSPASTSRTTSSTCTCPSCSAAGMRARRETHLPHPLRAGGAVVAMTSWGRRDFIESYDLPPGEGRRRPRRIGAAASTRPPPTGDLERAALAPLAAGLASCSIRRRPGPTRTTSGCWRRLRSIRDRTRDDDPAGLPRQADPATTARFGTSSASSACESRTRLPGLRQPLGAPRPLRAGDGAGLPEPVRGLGTAGLRGVLRRAPGRVVDGDRPARPGRRRRTALRPGEHRSDRRRRAADLDR